MKVPILLTEKHWIVINYLLGMIFRYILSVEYLQGSIVVTTHPA